MTSTSFFIPSVADRYGAEAAIRYRERGFWGDDSLSGIVDKWAAEAGERRAVTDGVRELSYLDLQRESLQLAGWLSSVGVTEGDRVAVQLPNWAEFVTTYLAINRLGAILVPVMPVYRTQEVHHILSNSGAVVAVTAGTFRGFDHLVF